MDLVLPWLPCWDTEAPLCRLIGNIELELFPEQGGRLAKVTAASNPELPLKIRYPTYEQMEAMKVWELCLFAPEYLSFTDTKRLHACFQLDMRTPPTWYRNRLLVPSCCIGIVKAENSEIAAFPRFVRT